MLILNEEVGELNKAVLERLCGKHKSSLDDIRTEALQTAAMCIRFLDNLDLYKWTL